MSDSPRRWLLAALCVLLAVVLAACDDDDGPSLECGDGTSEDGGQCLPDPVDTSANPGIECGDGTVLSGGRCVPIVDPGLACGPGTVLEQTRCVPINNAQCGDGTRVIPTREGDELIDYCVGDIVCGAGTYANLDGECIVDTMIVCGEGTVEHEGQCLDQIAALEQLTPIGELEPDDRSPAEFQLAAEAGNSVLLEGAIGTPHDLDGDQLPDQDVDYFAFTAQAGTVIELRAFANGLPSPHVRVVGGTSQNAFFVRETAVLTDLQPRREIVLPVGGRYVVQVTDQFAPGVTPSSTTEPFGNSSYGYFVAITTRPSLDPQDSTTFMVGDTLDGSYAEGVRGRLWNGLLLDGIDTLLARIVSDSDTHVGALMVFDDQLQFRYEFRGYDTGDAVALPVPAFQVEDDVFVLVDWVSASGRAVDSTFSVDLDALDTSALPLDDGATLAPGAQETWALGPVGAGELVWVRAESSASGASTALLVTLVDHDSQRVVARHHARGAVDLAWFADSAANLTLTVENLRGEDLPVGVLVDAVAPGAATDVGSTAMVTGLTPAAPGWFVFDSDDQQALGLALELSGATGSAPQVTLWTQDAENVYPAGDFPRGGDTLELAAPSAFREHLIGRIDVAAATDLTVTTSAASMIAVGSSNNRCEGALDLGTPATATLTVPLAALTNRISPLLANTCHDEGAADHIDGPDAFAALEVPPGATLVATASGSDGDVDPALELVALTSDDCGLLGGELGSEWLCLDAVADVAGTAEAVARYHNDGASTQRVLVIIDSDVSPRAFGVGHDTLVALTVVTAP